MTALQNEINNFPGKLKEYENQIELLKKENYDVNDNYDAYIVEVFQYCLFS